MNSKLMSYEEAVEQLKYEEILQRINKNGIAYGIQKGAQDKPMYKQYQRSIQEKKVRINELLTIIHLHKQSRKLWAEKEKYLHMVSGISSTKRGGSNG